jgi:hypothetical protein
MSRQILSSPGAVPFLRATFRRSIDGDLRDTFILYIWEDASMTEISKAPAEKSKGAKSSINWPVLIAAGVCIMFVVGVWVNNYRVSHAAANPTPIAAKK